MPPASATGNIHIGTMVGKVERRDAGDHAQRLAQRMAVDAGADVLGHFALQQLRRGGGEFDDFHAALDFALGIGQHLAVFGGDDGGEFVGALFEDAQELVEDAGPAQRRGHGPGGEGLLGDGDGGIDVSRRGEADRTPTVRRWRDCRRRTLRPWVSTWAPLIWCGMSLGMGVLLIVWRLMRFHNFAQQ